MTNRYANKHSTIAQPPPPPKLGNRKKEPPAIKHPFLPAKERSPSGAPGTLPARPSERRLFTAPTKKSAKSSKRRTASIRGEPRPRSSADFKAQLEGGEKRSGARGGGPRRPARAAPFRWRELGWRLVLDTHPFTHIGRRGRGLVYNRKFAAIWCAPVQRIFGCIPCRAGEVAFG